jgi:gas vesicle protein
MADRFDRFDNEGSGGGGFMMGFLTGTVLGAGLGMLFAPKAGAALRSRLSAQAGTLANTAAEGYRKATENAGPWAEKGRDAASEGLQNVATRVADVVDRVADIADDVTRRGQAVRDDVADAVGRGAHEVGRGAREVVRGASEVERFAKVSKTDPNAARS